ncbi:hypothetical protein [Lutispora sp.]|jgi:hypothetical protein|uniref:hypothetical protein n=1 Tax=Lutispora sp. TaxID=2828727 RepID=UPI003568BDE6
MIIDGAEVIAISQKDNFGVIKYGDNSIKSIPIEYLAICQYENDKQFYVFLCNGKFEVEQDIAFNTMEEAKRYAYKINRHIQWEDGIKYVKFDDVDFKGGKVNKLEIFYPNGYMIDIGYIDDMKSFVISIIKDNDWVNIVKEIEVKSDIDLKQKLIEIIQWVIEIQEN